MTKKLKHDDATWFDALKWRCIGPPRGGRVVAVAGDPKDAMTFYFGACAGGIWKTNDGGVYWRCVSDGFLKTAAIGVWLKYKAPPDVTPAVAFIEIVDDVVDAEAAAALA